jgi:hypothetical protein
MAEGLRVIGACPRCRGELAFPDTPPDDEPPTVMAPEPEPDARPPHLVLGLPRR